MTPAELREACEEADVWFVKGHYWERVEDGGRAIHPLSATLAPYVASILVGKVREADKAVDAESYVLKNGDADQVIFDATPEQQIRAAFFVLSGRELAVREACDE